MGELTINKYIGSLLAAALILFGLRELAHLTFAPPSHGGHGGHGEEQSLNAQFAEKYAYYVEVAEERAEGEPEPVFDLGAALAAADASRGERAFNAKCSTCHSVAEGGPQGTGPNLWNVVGAEKNHVAGFNYSGALTEGETWTYAAMNEWLYNPSAYAPGTSMAFAGLRRDEERANVIAYLAEMSPDAPAFPEPMPAAGEAEEAADSDEAPAEAAPAPAPGEAVEETVAADPANPTQATGQIETGDVVDGVGPNDGDVGEVVVVPEEIETLPEAGEAVRVAEGIGITDEAVKAETAEPEAGDAEASTPEASGEAATEAPSEQD